MSIAIFGRTDKRFFIMALFNLLQKFGEILFVTSNNHYCRLSKGFSKIEFFENILIVNSENSLETILPELGYVSTDFDFIIYDVIDSLPENISIILYVTSDCISAEEVDEITILSPTHIVWQLYNDFDLVSARLTRKVKNLEISKNNSFSISLQMLQELEIAEAKQRSVRFKNKSLARTLFYIFGDILNLSLKNINILLQRGGSY